MSSTRLPGIVVTASLVALASGCGGDTSSSPSGDVALPEASASVDLSGMGFSTTIDNEYFPLVPGSRAVYKEVENGSTTRVVVTVTGVTKDVAAGVTARVVRDTVSEDGEVVEDTFDWYAQDEEGNVWYLGEDTAEFEDGEVASREGAWEAGVDGAQAGVIMPADPEAGQSYREEYLEGEAEDNGAVLSVDEMADVEAGHYDHVVLVKDTSGIEPDVLEYKLYAAGVGAVLTLGVSGDVGREELVRTETIPDAAAVSSGTTPLGEPYR